MGNTDGDTDGKLLGTSDAVAEGYGDKDGKLLGTSDAVAEGFGDEDGKLLGDSDITEGFVDGCNDVDVVGGNVVDALVGDNVVGEPVVGEGEAVGSSKLFGLLVLRAFGALLVFGALVFLGSLLSFGSLEAFGSLLSFGSLVVSFGSLVASFGSLLSFGSSVASFGSFLSFGLVASLFDPFGVFFPFAVDDTGRETICTTFVSCLCAFRSLSRSGLSCDFFISGRLGYFAFPFLLLLDSFFVLLEVVAMMLLSILASADTSMCKLLFTRPRITNERTEYSRIDLLSIMTPTFFILHSRECTQACLLSS